MSGERDTMPEKEKDHPANLILRHEDEVTKERSACGYRYRLLSKGDEDVAAWAHAVDIDGARPHFHKRTTELYYVLEGEGKVVLDGEEREVRPGTMIHIPPGVVHGAIGKMRVLVVGIPDIDDSDVFYPEDAESNPS
ncbi:MAG: cupin domain-containing protein [Roseibacillus sp.]|jgi:mannose-6-phosphate isomerase-like protein (cupin superfamily)